MARLYRLGLNGRIRSDEMTRFIYALKEINIVIFEFYNDEGTADEG
jgi:hypothetical protein